MKRFIALIAMFALSGAAFATNGGEGNNTGCNGQGNPNSPCQPQDNGGGNGDPRGGGNGGAGGIGIGVGVGVATAVNNTAVTNTNQNVNNNNVSVQNSVTNTATGGNATATGGEGGSAVAAAVVENGAVQVSVAEGAVQSNYSYKEVKQAPSIGQGSFAITGCSIAGNAGGSGPGWSGFLGFGFTPQQCYDFMLAQAYQSIGEKKAVCDILKNSKAGKRQADRGITLPECLPEAPQTVVVPAPVDLSPYATKEELNRAFKASMTK